MSVPTVRFENNDRAAHAVFDYLSALTPSSQRFSLRSFNRFATEFTEWWFVPNEEWPAFRNSKLFIHRFQPPTGPGKWFCTGFYVEKGLGKQLLDKHMQVKRGEIMQDDWYWHDFIRHARAGEYDLAVREVSTRSECPVVLSLSAYEFNNVPRFDTERREPRDRMELVVQSSDDSFGPEPAQKGVNIFTDLNGAANLRELADRLDRLKDQEWFWLNLTIGVRLHYGTASSGSWGPAEIWRDALEPWNTWVR